MADAHGVGSGHSAHAWADALGEIAARSETVEIRMRHEPAPHQRKLIAALGGVIVIDPAAPMCCPDCKGGDVSATTAPPVLNCRSCGHPFRQHAFGGDCTLASCDCPRFVVADDTENGNGRAASVSSSSSEAAKSEAPARSSAIPSPWTRDSIIAAIQRWAREHGGPPTGTEWERANDDHPNGQLVRTRFGTWAAAIEAAGFPRPTKATRRGRPAAQAPGPPADPPTSDASAAPAAPVRPQPARAELKPPAPPPAAVVDASPAIRITSLEVQQGRWQLYRGPEGECRLGFDAQGSVRIPWDALEQLPALIAAVGQAFGAAGD